jgi:4'-phosphopantetheinyl transferase EntD
MLRGANRLIARLLPNYVAVAEGLITDWQPDLWPEEAAYVANAAEKRRREFACGRHFVRSCLRSLGRPDEPLPVRPDRSPRWPDGLVGSITHTDTYCAAAVARADDIASIGIDVEDLSRFEPALLPYVSSPGDITRNFLGTSGVDCSLGATLFSAKETFYKCLVGLAQAEFDYGDVGIEFIDGSDVFYGRLLRPVGHLSVARGFIGHYVVVGDQVATAMILPREGERYPGIIHPNPTARATSGGRYRVERVSQRDSDNCPAVSE